tara:strand:- start:331 stop:507 length:177 start_codon:yes stop_codon:yes gene_type:complete
MMDSSKVVITKQKVLTHRYLLENEIGLSSYDLALISIEKIINRNLSCENEVSETTYLI